MGLSQRPVHNDGFWPGALGTRNVGLTASLPLRAF